VLSVSTALRVAEDGGRCMELKTIHCFLVHPAKHEESQPALGGTSVSKHGQLFTMLKGIFEKAESDCRTDISFNHAADGKQQNEFRDLLLAYIKSHSIKDGRKIALRLQGVTTQKPGLGLLFLMLGQEGERAKIVLSRFPADQGVLAQEGKDSLTVEFLEKVFMKSATAYKAASYVGKLTDADFWTGRAVDKQRNNLGDQLAHYWIREFLASDLRTTAATGTKRLAVALRTAMSNLTDGDAKRELAAAVTLAPNLTGQTTSAEEFCTQFGLSSPATEAVRKIIKQESLMTEHFQFDAAEFSHHIAFRSVELSNGAILTAEASKFDEVFQQEAVGQAVEEVRFTTQGRVVAQQLRRAKP